MPRGFSSARRFGAELGKIPREAGLWQPDAPEHDLVLKHEANLVRSAPEQTFDEVGERLEHGFSPGLY